jgi:hypothetical protein
VVVFDLVDSPRGPDRFVDFRLRAMASRGQNLDRRISMTGLGRFWSGFKSGYHKQQEITAAKPRPKSANWREEFTTLLACLGGLLILSMRDAPS